MRREFSKLSQEIGVLARAFGFGEVGPVYELHCPMAFNGRGAIWYQDNDVVQKSILWCFDAGMCRSRRESRPPRAGVQRAACG